DGSRTDISAQTSPHFPSRSPDGFIELVRAGEPSVRALWRFPRFLARHPRALRTLRGDLATLKPPPSYAAARYYAIHAFRWVAAGTIAITGVASGADDLVFDPMRLVDGIEPSDDPILKFRPRAYAVSAQRRLT